MMLPPVSAPLSLSEDDRPGGVAACSEAIATLGVSIANVSCSCRLAVYRPRVVDIELDKLAIAGRRRHGDLRRALRREKAVQCTLRDDGHHSRAEDERLGRPVIAHDLQDRRAVDDVNQLVAGMRFPMI